MKGAVSADRTLPGGFLPSIVVLTETVVLAAVSAPIAHGSAWDACAARDLAVVHAQQRQIQNELRLGLGPHRIPSPRSYNYLCHTREGV